MAKKERVYLTWTYSDVVHVVAKDEQDAINRALDMASPIYESWDDAKVTEEFDE